MLLQRQNFMFKYSIRNESLKLKERLLLSTFTGFTKTEISKGTYLVGKPEIIKGLGKNHLKCDCGVGIIVNGIRQPIKIALQYINFLVTRYLKHVRLNLKGKQTNMF